MGINDIVHFDFMDPPPIHTLVVAMEQLYASSDVILMRCITHFHTPTLPLSPLFNLQLRSRRA
jgi:hypothetical protein